jgi:hypothetical protein
MCRYEVYCQIVSPVCLSRILLEPTSSPQWEPSVREALDCSFLVPINKNGPPLTGFRRNTRKQGTRGTSRCGVVDADLFRGRLIEWEREFAEVVRDKRCELRLLENGLAVVQPLLFSYAFEHEVWHLILRHLCSGGGRLPCGWLGSGQAKQRLECGGRSNP